MFFLLKKFNIIVFSETSLKRKKKNRSFLSGFTLLELLVTVTISAVVAAFAIPNYKKSVVTSEQKSLVQQMMVAKEALKLYRLREGQYPEDDIYGSGGEVTSAINELNGMLNINLIVNINGINCDPDTENHSFYTCEFEINENNANYALVLDTRVDKIICDPLEGNACYYCNIGQDHECPDY